MSELSRVTVTTNGSVMNSGTSDQAIEAAPYLVRTFDGGGDVEAYALCMYMYVGIFVCLVLHAQLNMAFPVGGKK